VSIGKKTHTLTGRGVPAVSEVLTLSTLGLILERVHFGIHIFQESDHISIVFQISEGQV
jgi:hypothetical protein